MFEEEPDTKIVEKMSNGVTKEQNMKLMCMKYDRAVEDPFKLKANREFLFMQKILLNKAYCAELHNKMPLVGFMGTQRIEQYDDELTYLNDESKIQKVQMSSEPKRNFVLIQMDNIIFKYDLISKELLFRWKTQDNSEIILFDKDDKLCTVSKTSVRLWDFEDGIEQPPSIWATEEWGKSTTVERVFINEGSVNDNKDKNSLHDDKFIVVVTSEKDKPGCLVSVYKNRLDRTNVQIPIPEQKVTAACFSERNDILFIGLNNGNMRFINLLECCEVDDE